MKTNHRRSASGGKGFMCWSVLDGLVTVKVPWSDLLLNGDLNGPHFRGSIDSLRKFEEKLEGWNQNDAWPPMPTPNSHIIRIDNAVFEADLRKRVAAHVSALRLSGRGDA